MSAVGPASTVDATSPARPADEAGASAPEVEREPEVLLEVGEHAGDFVIEGVLGRGSFGTVYRAAHAVIGRRAAVKVLREQAAEAHRVEAFIEEARLVARLRHPNIVDVLTFGRLADGRHFQVMDLIEGPTLADFLREHGALTLEAALPILRGVASALDAVHRSGVAHRDLKPANVVLERREGVLVPKLIDFGVAELVAADDEPTPSRRGGLVGTPRYMAPEQCRGRAVDARSDVYAFGLLAYEMLTGRPPFSGDDALALMLKHTSEVPVPPSKQLGSLPAALDPILLDLLAKRPEQRPLELFPVVQAFEALVAGESPSPTSPRGAVAVAPRPSRGRRLAAVGLVIASLAAGGVLLRRGDGAASPGPPSAAAGRADDRSAPGSTALPAPPASASEPVAVPETKAMPVARGVADTLASEVRTPGEASARTSTTALPSSAVPGRGTATRRPPARPSSSDEPGGPGLEDSENPFGAR